MFAPGETPPPPAPPPQAAMARQISKASEAARMATTGGYRLTPAESSARARKAHSKHTGNQGSGRPGQPLEGGEKASDRAVVCTVRVAWAEPEAGICTVEEENEHVAPLGTPLQASETGMSNPLSGVMVKVYFAVCPAWIESLAGEAARVKSENCTESASVAVPAPEVEDPEVEVVDGVVLDEVVVVAVPVTLKMSADEVTAFRFPTVRVLDWPGTMEEGLKAQVAGETLAQPSAMEPVNPTAVEAEMVNWTWPVPINTVSELGFAASANGGAPVPVRVIVCGEPRPVSVIVTVPTLVPSEEGEKVTAMLQLAPAFTTLPQLLVSE